MASKPTERSLALCKKKEWLATVVERYIHQTRRRHDAFGFGDILVVDGGLGSLMVQACSDGDVSKRRKKIIEDRTENARRWLEVGNRIEVWGWGKKGPRGKRKLWTLRAVPVQLIDLPPRN